MKLANSVGVSASSSADRASSAMLRASSRRGGHIHMVRRPKMATPVATSVDLPFPQDGGGGGGVCRGGAHPIVAPAKRPPPWFSPRGFALPRGGGGGGEDRPGGEVLDQTAASS